MVSLAVDRHHDIHAHAWQITAEVARQTALIWHVAAIEMPEGQGRALIAQAVNQIAYLADLQDALMAELATHLPTETAPP